MLYKSQLVHINPSKLLLLFSHQCCLPLRSYIDTNLWVFLIYLYLHFFPTQFINNNNNNNKKFVQPDPCGLGWVEVF